MPLAKPKPADTASNLPAPQPRKTAYSSHAWLGVVTGLLLFIVCFTGSVAVFHSEIYQWEQPGLQQKSSPQTARLTIDSLVQMARQRHDMPDDFSIALPDHPYRDIAIIYYQQNGKTRQHWLSASSGETLPEGRSEITEILSHIHTDLDLPKPYGRYLVGLSGVVMLFLLISGIIHHRRFFKDMFRLRRPKKRQAKLLSFRITVSELHKIIGTWGIVFQAMIAFTGSMLGLVSLVLLLMAFAAYDGDSQAALDGFLGPTPEHTGIAAPMQAFSNIITTAEAHWQGFEVGYLNINNYGDSAAKITVYGDFANNLTGIQNLSFSGVSGEVMFVSDFRNMGIGAAIYGVSDTLHYAEFGGTLIKFLYLFLGVAVSGMGISGMMMWLEKQRKNDGKYVFYSRLTVGVVAGLLTATAFLFVTASLYPESWADKAELQHRSYYYVWLAMIFIAYATPTVRGYLRLTALLCGTFFLSAALLNTALIVINNGLSSIAILQHNHTIIGVNLTLLLLGAVFLQSYWRLGRN